ncbi:hypothetical protein [Thermogemmata fonticola]|jgi:capsid protein|uniref:Uncharacterized protein n=1 Tax=Thermogemmata fonticola TaxID=2755323 RepID=A0A7V8VAQ1_9BACT|nr:hypothetical protein [Thermogemmata fonticola]MBA2224584.1 hypothetical protein [Thermogemmata fonticola]
MPDDLEAEIRKNAEGPAKASGDAGSVEQHPLPDQIEADQVATPELATLNANAVDGIVFDAAGNPVEYHVLKDRPGANCNFIPCGGR